MRRETKEAKVEAFQQVTTRLAGCRHMIHDSPWAGLTELTNEKGSMCHDSVSDNTHDVQKITKTNMNDSAPLKLGLLVA
jgi:hypothetical protein